MKEIKYLFLILAVIAFSYCMIGQMCLPADELDQSSLCEEYHGKWYQLDEDGVRSPIELPGKYEKGSRQLVTDIPYGLNEKITCLCFRAQDLRAYLDEKLIYVYSTEKTRLFGKNSTECYLMIPLKASDAGKVLRIEMVSDTGLLYQPYVGSEMGIWRTLIHLYAGDMGVAIVTLIMGLLTILISKIYEAATKKRMDIAYLGCGVTFAAIWLITNSIVRQIMFSNVSVASDMPYLMVMLLPFPFIIYMNEIQLNRYVKLYRSVGITLGVIAVTVCALYVGGIYDIEGMFIWVACGSFFAIGSVIYTFIMDMRRGNIKEYRYVAFGLLGALVAAIIQLTLYFNRTGIFRGSYLALGLLILLVGSAIHTVQYLFAIEKEKQAAEIANESKSRFLAHMSHEIRTPINAVLGMDEMILRESKELSVREYALDIQNAGKSLLALINDILDISKIDSGKLEIIPVEYDVSSMIHDTVNMIYQKAISKELSVEIHVDENLPSRLRGDDVRIRQVLLNILNNAVKYTEHGSITLSVDGEKKDQKLIMHFAVKDTGIGIKEEDMPKLFEEFQRIEENRHHNVEGTGLGMSITVQLLKLMGSHIEMTSTYGEGSCFFFDLEQEIMDETPVGKLSERIKQQEQEYIHETTFTAPDADILVVDDNAVNRKVLRNLLKDTRMRIDEADSGEECLKKVVNKKYDLIFMDHMMPGMDGIETLHAFPQQEGNLNLETPVIALTANAVTGAKEMFLENGFNDFFSKPIVYHKLEKSIKKYLPKNKMIEGSVMQSQEQLRKEAEEVEQMKQRLESIPELNLEYAYLHNKSPKDLYGVVEDFAQMADSDAAALNAFEKQISDDENLRQYRVKVHAMKTSAAMIGALTVSSLAKVLEYAARDEKRDVIERMHGIFMEEWKLLTEHLKAVCIVETEDQELLELDEALIAQELKLLTQAMEEYDVDVADEIIERLSHYRYSEEKKAVFDEMAAAVRRLDADAVEEGASKLL